MLVRGIKQIQLIIIFLFGIYSRYKRGYYMMKKKYLQINDMFDMYVRKWIFTCFLVGGENNLSKLI